MGGRGTKYKKMAIFIVLYNFRIEWNNGIFLIKGTFFSFFLAILKCHMFSLSAGILEIYSTVLVAGDSHWCLPHSSFRSLQSCIILFLLDFVYILLFCQYNFVFMYFKLYLPVLRTYPGSALRDHTCWAQVIICGARN